MRVVLLSSVSYQIRIKGYGKGFLGGIAVPPNLPAFRKQSTEFDIKPDRKAQESLILANIALEQFVRIKSGQMSDTRDYNRQVSVCQDANHSRSG